MENGLITTYKYDEYGYYDGDVTTQVFNGAALMPPMCIKKAPELKEGYFYKINDNEDGWIAEEKPTCAKECLNIVVDHEDNSHRAVELKKLMQDFCEKDAEHFRVKRGEDLSWTVEAIPENTFDELKKEKLEEVSAEAGKYDQYKCDEMYITSSVNSLQINADARSQKNISALIENYTDVVTFKTYDNNYVQLNKDELKTMLAECVKNGEALYAQKWSLQEQVNNAKTKEDLNKIEVKFTMMSFN